MLSLYTSKFVVQTNATEYCFVTTTFAAYTQEEAEKEAIYRMVKAYPRDSVRLLESNRIDDYLIDLVYRSRNE